MLTLSQKPSVQDIRAQLSALVATAYPQATKLKVKKYHKTGCAIRAKFRKRRIWCRAFDPSVAVIRFFDELNRKAYLEPYVENC
jgi:hypothetical protein